jgi:LacI family transcriptional regulator
VVTHKDIANYVGVSQATVSKVLTNKSNNISISPKTRQAVIDAARLLGYNKDKVASGLIQLVDQSVAILLEHIANPFLSVIMNGMEKELSDTQYHFLFASSNGVAQQSLEIIQMLTRRYTTGFIMMPFYESNTSQQVHKYLKVRGIPFVQTNYYNLPGELDAPLVSTNNFEIFKQLTHHLIALGHERIALVYTSPDYSCMQQRLAGYRAALDEAGLPYDPSLEILIPRAEYLTPQIKEQLLNRWLRRSKNRPSALMTFKDDCALQFIELLHRRGLKVPEDMAVTGFDDYRYFIQNFTPEVYYRLTTIRQNLVEIGRTAARRLIQEIESDKSQELPMRIEVPAKIIVRGSCGATVSDEITPGSSPLLSIMGRAI